MMSTTLFLLMVASTTFTLSNAMELKSSARIRYVARVMYDGTGFHGWQEQGRLENGRKVRTVQETLSKTLQKRLAMQLRTTGASRTDQGVHARGQCVHFDVLPEKQFDDFAQFEYSCNRMLPDDIRIFNVTRAPLGNSEQLAQDRLFHATTSSTGKLYSYRFCTAPFIEPNQRNYCTHVWYPVDISLFEHCLSLFVGTHDFTAFANQVEQTLKVFNEKNIQLRRERTVESIRLIDEGAGYYRVEFRIRSALYRMIRNIVGTSLRVAAGDMPLTQLQQLLAEAPSRIQNPAKSAPPQGLCLEHVYYDHY